MQRIEKEDDNDEVTDNYEESSRGLVTFIPGPFSWLLIWALWVAVAIGLYSDYGNIGIAIAVFVGLAYLLYAKEEIQADEMAVSVIQGREASIAKSGIALVLKPLYSLPSKWRYSTKEQMVVAEPIDIITTAGNSADGYHSSTITNNRFSIYFRWSNTKNGLHKAVTRAPNPQNASELKSYIGQIVNDVMRQVGGIRQWRDLVQMGYAVEPVQKALNGTGILITRIVNLNTKIDYELGKSLPLPEIAGYKANAAVIIREAILGYILKHGDTAMELEKMRTIVETAEGGNMTYLGFPTQIYSALESRVGGKSAQQAFGMSTEELNQAIAKEVRKQRKYRR